MRNDSDMLIYVLNKYSQKNILHIPKKKEVKYNLCQVIFFLNLHLNFTIYKSLPINNQYSQSTLWHLINY